MPFNRACSEIGLAFGQRSVGLNEADSPQNDTLSHTHGIFALGWKGILPLPREVPTYITHHGQKDLTGFLRAHPLLCCWPNFPSNPIYVHDCSGHIWRFRVRVAFEWCSLGLASQQQVWRYTLAGLFPSFVLGDGFLLDSWGCWGHFHLRSS